MSREADVCCRQQGGESPDAEAKSDGMANGASSAGAAEQAPSSGSSLLDAVSFHALESRNDGALWDCSPGCVIMYDSDVAFVRQLEVKPELHSLTFLQCLPGMPCLQALLYDCP